MDSRQSPRVLDSLALAHFLSGDPAKAAALERQALALVPESESELRAELTRKLEKYIAAAKEAGLPLEDEPEP